MKFNLRFVLAALLLACVIALPFNSSAVAKVKVVPATATPTPTPTPTPTTAPAVSNCQTSASENQSGTMVLCSADVNIKSGIPVGGVGNVSQVNLAQFPALPGQGKFSTGVNITILDKNSNPVNALVEVCFSNSGGSGYVYRWVTASEWKAWYNVVQNGSWVLFPTYNKAGGLTCTKSWVTGTFALQH
jgi:hypothetical protein